jgi:hypothetical protein
LYSNVEKALWKKYHVEKDECYNDKSFRTIRKTLSIAIQEVMQSTSLTTKILTDEYTESQPADVELFVRLANIFGQIDNAIKEKTRRSNEEAIREQNKRLANWMIYTLPHGDDGQQQGMQLEGGIWGLDANENSEDRVTYETTQDDEVADGHDGQLQGMQLEGGIWGLDADENSEDRKTYETTHDDEVADEYNYELVGGLKRKVENNEYNERSNNVRTRDCDQDHVQYSNKTFNLMELVKYILLL